MRVVNVWLNEDGFMGPYVEDIKGVNEVDEFYLLDALSKNLAYRPDGGPGVHDDWRALLPTRLSKVRVVFHTPVEQ